LPNFIKIPDKTKLYQAVDTENIKAVVGGKNTDNFAPSVNVSFRMQSGQEKYFLNLCDDIDQIKTVGKEEDWKDNKLKIRDGDEESTFELHETSLKVERVFYKKPKRVPRYKLKYSKGVSFYYQDELTQEEINEGFSRPDEVVGSYAVYCDKAGHFKKRNGETIVNYSTGKIGHIYAPYWTDAANKKIKGTQRIVNDFLIFDLPPQEWINGAILPIKLDPNIGYTTIGGTNYTSEPRARFSGQSTASSGGTASKIWFYISGGWNRTFEAGYYDSSNNLVDSGTKSSGFTNNAWNSVDVTGTITNGSTYAPAVAWSTTGYGTAKADYTGSGNLYQVRSDLPSTRSGSSASVCLSLYLEYTEGGSTILPINNAGSVDISSYNPSVFAGKTVNSSTGIVTASGLNASISQGSTIPTTIGTIGTTALQAEVIKATTVLANSASISVAPLNTTISTGTIIDVTSESVSVSGINPSISAGVTISISKENITAVGLGVTVSNGAVIQAGSASLAISGLDTVISKGSTIQATAGSISATTKDLTISAGKNIESDSGSVSISGYAASISAGTTISALAGSLSVSSFNCSVESTIIIDVSTGSVIITGPSSTIQSGEHADTPADRTCVILLENRTCAILLENRTAEIERENRTYTIT
jgi:hypothetical protein